MDYTEQIILTVLAGLPLAVIAVYAPWMLKLQRDLKSGRRVRLKWKDLSLPKKLYSVAFGSYLVLVLYSEWSFMIPILTGTRLPFITELQVAVTTLWLGTVGLIGFGLFYTLRSPVRRQPSRLF